MSRFKAGELLRIKQHAFGTVIWTEDLMRATDGIDNHELLITITPENDSGWTKVLSPRGIEGYAHRNNILRLND